MSEPSSRLFFGIPFDLSAPVTFHLSTADENKKPYIVPLKTCFTLIFPNLQAKEVDVVVAYTPIFIKDVFKVGSLVWAQTYKDNYLLCRYKNTELVRFGMITTQKI